VETPTKGPNVTASELGPLLNRIIGSPGFRRALRLQRFLRYVTHHAVHYPGRPLKEIQVAMAVFDKDVSFEPRLDPIVRVEAGRLRLRLLEYYAEAGDEEPIVIEVPRGGYVPIFRVFERAHPAPVAGETENPVAYRLCLKGRYFWGKRTTSDLAKAAEYFRRALAVESDYARAYLGLADCNVVLGYFGFAPPGEVCPKAKAAAMAALDIDRFLSEAHATLASLSALYEWDRDRAEAGFRRAIAMQPGYAFAHQLYGVSLIAWRRFEEGLAALKTAEQLEPLAPMIETQLAAGFYVAGKQTQAEESCQTALELEPNFWPAHYFLALVLEQEGRYGEAIRELERAVELSAGNLLTVGSLGHAYAHAGRPSEAHRVLDQLRSREASSAYVPPFAVALIRTGLVDKDAAFEMLENAYRERSPLLGIWLTTEPRLEILRSDPRFSELIARTGFLGGGKASILFADAS
jgi:tetratricopeptide (TPR) repeat protein